MQDRIYQKLITGEEAYKYTYEELYKEIEDYGYDNTQYITDFFWNLSEDKYYLKSDRLLFFDQKTKKKYSLIYSEYYNLLKKFIAIYILKIKMIGKHIIIAFIENYIAHFIIKINYLYKYDFKCKRYL